MQMRGAGPRISPWGPRGMCIATLPGMRIHLVIISGALGVATPALAQEAEETILSGDPDAQREIVRGAFLPFMDTPGTAVTRVVTHGFYNSAVDRARVESIGQIRVTPRIQLEAGLAFEAAESAPSLAAHYYALDEDTSAIDLRVGGGWDSSGINRVSAVFGEVAAGRSVAGNYLMGSARLDLGSAERGMRLGLAGVRPIYGGFSAGVDSRMTVDLNRDEMQINEASWALTAGPVVTYGRERVAVIGSAGVAANKPHATSTDVGGYGSLGLGLAF
jgi:hypothetical protein